jgi:hypothetical protein
MTPRFITSLLCGLIAMGLHVSEATATPNHHHFIYGQRAEVWCVSKHMRLTTSRTGFKVRCRPSEAQYKVTGHSHPTLMSLPSAPVLPLCGKGTLTTSTSDGCDLDQGYVDSMVAQRVHDHRPSRLHNLEFVLVGAVVMMAVWFSQKVFRRLRQSPEEQPAQGYAYGSPPQSPSEGELLMADDGGGMTVTWEIDTDPSAPGSKKPHSLWHGWGGRH